jgi:diketogulonate reductase-like aldo/keto reductase
MTQIKLCEAVDNDMLVTYCNSKELNVKVISFMKVMDDKHVKIIAGKSRRANPKVIQYDNRDSVLAVYNIRPQDYVERNADYSDIIFFRLTDEETHLLMAEFV